MSNSMKIVLFLGLVSLFGDMVYETSRSVIGPYLRSLGADAFLIGIIFGFGEFLGYSMRIVSGYMVDKTRNYWVFMFIGYSLIGFLPLLGITDSLYLASSFVLLERIGKGLRAPAKDTILSIYTPEMKKGIVFGIHEMADQIGAVAGPLLFSLFLILGLGYKNSFIILFIPFLFIIMSLTLAKIHSKKIVITKEKVNILSSNKPFYLYLIFVFLTSMGFIGFPVISFHISKTGILEEKYIPLIYSILMLVDGFFAIPIGIIYDKMGFKIMGFVPFTTLLVGVFLFSGLIPLIFIGLVLWGIVVAFYETVIRAFIADVVPLELKGKFFGIFNTVLGLSLLMGNSIMGWFYEKNIFYIFYFIIVLQISSLLFFLKIRNIIKS